MRETEREITYGRNHSLKKYINEYIFMRVTGDLILYICVYNLTTVVDELLMLNYSCSSLSLKRTSRDS